VPGKRFPTGSALSRENLCHICHVTIPSFLSVCVQCEFSLEEGHFVNMYAHCCSSNPRRQSRFCAAFTTHGKIHCHLFREKPSAHGILRQCEAASRTGSIWWLLPADSVLKLLTLCFLRYLERGCRHDTFKRMMPYSSIETESVPIMYVAQPRASPYRKSRPE
jgi:hypothetical protein